MSADLTSPSPRSDPGEMPEVLSLAAARDAEEPAFVLALSSDQPPAAPLRSAEQRGWRFIAAEGARLWVRLGRGCSPARSVCASVQVTARTVGVLVGHVDNRQELLRVLAPPAQLAGEASADIANTGDAVLLEPAYGRWGRDLPHHLIGEFTLLLLDREQPCLIAARDALGVRPLFCVEVGRSLWIASELALLLESLPEQPAVDPSALAEYFCSGGAFSGRTFFRGITQVPPAHVLEVRPSGRQLVRTWQPAVDPLPTGSGPFLERVYQQVAAAVRPTLADGQPTWIHLSGGLDSSTLVCMAAALAGVEPRFPGDVTVLSHIATETSACDERPYQQEVLNATGFLQHTLDLDAHRPFTCWRPVHQPDGGLFDGSLYLGTRRLAERLGVHRCLNGSGGDQVFLSYFPPLHLGAWLRQGALGKWLRGVADWLGGGKYSLWQLVAHHSRGQIEDDLVRRMAPPPWMRSAFFAGVRDQLLSDLLGGPRVSDNPATELHWRYISTFAPRLYARAELGDTRYPLLHRPLVELALAVPWDEKISPTENRRFQREALAGLLPAAIRTRKTKASLLALLLKGLRGDWSRVEPLTRAGDLADLGVLEPHAFAEACRRFKDGVTTGLPFFLATLALQAWLALDVPGQMSRHRCEMRRWLEGLDAAAGGRCEERP